MTSRYKPERLMKVDGVAPISDFASSYQTGGELNPRMICPRSAECKGQGTNPCSSVPSFQQTWDNVGGMASWKSVSRIPNLWFSISMTVSGRICLNLMFLITPRNRTVRGWFPRFPTEQEQMDRSGQLDLRTKNGSGVVRFPRHALTLGSLRARDPWRYQIPEVSVPRDGHVWPT